MLKWLQFSRPVSYFVMIAVACLVPAGDARAGGRSHLGDVACPPPVAWVSDSGREWALAFSGRAARCLGPKPSASIICKADDGTGVLTTGSPQVVVASRRRALVFGYSATLPLDTTARFWQEPRHSPCAVSVESGEVLVHEGRRRLHEGLPRWLERRLDASFHVQAP